MIFRVAAALIFTAVGAVIGFSLTDRLRSAKKSCNSVEHLLRRSIYIIGIRREDVYGLCRNLKGDVNLKCLKFLQKLPYEYRTGEDFHTIWRESLDSEKNICSEEKEILYRFGEILGRSDSVSQISQINGFLKELEQLSELRRQELLKKGRLYQGAGVLFGIMAGILVL